MNDGFEMDLLHSLTRFNYSKASLENLREQFDNTLETSSAALERGGTVLAWASLPYRLDRIPETPQPSSPPTLYGVHPRDTPTWKGVVGFDDSQRVRRVRRVSGRERAS